MIKNITQRLLALIVGTAVTYGIATVAVSQFNLQRIIEMGHAVRSDDRVATTLHDLSSMIGPYGTLLLVALLVAFLFTGLILARFVSTSAVLYAAAGFVAVITLHLTLYQVFSMSPVAPTRTMPGMLSQALAGAIGGIVYFKMRPTVKATTND